MPKTKVHKISQSSGRRRVDRDASPVRTPEKPTSAPEKPTSAPSSPALTPTDAEIDALLAKHATSEAYEAIVTLVNKCRALDTITQEIIDMLRYTLEPQIIDEDRMVWNSTTPISPNIRALVHASLRLLSEFCETSLQKDLEVAEDAHLRYGADMQKYRTYFEAMPFPNLYLCEWPLIVPRLIMPPTMLDMRGVSSLIAAHHACIIANVRDTSHYYFKYPRALAKYAAQRANLRTLFRMRMSADDLLLKCDHSVDGDEAPCVHFLSLEGPNEGLHYSKKECSGATWPDDVPKPLEWREGMHATTSLHT